LTEPRKATDVLLDLEQKLDVALNIIRAQDLNIKILSNKLNSVIETLEKQGAPQPKITVEAIHSPLSQLQQAPYLDAERQIPISSESTLPLEREPNGFRRTSRPETFQGDDIYLNQRVPKSPSQVPKTPAGRGSQEPSPGPTAEIVVQPPKLEAEVVFNKPVTKPVFTGNSVPVTQRVVNAQGKSLFLADVEIIDLSTMQQVAKTRTNGTGKWLASLGVGNYRVIIRKIEQATKEKLEATQDIRVDGSQSPLELQTVIIKA